jgi:2-hydroxychromene-2-carboxylate isomerase
MASLEVFFDISSPWTYLGFENVQPLARSLDVEIAWRPILVGGLFNTINPTVYESREKPVVPKMNYMKKSLQDWARVSGLEIGWPTVFPVNSVKVMRGCFDAESHGKLVPYARAAFEAYWRDDKDISQELEVAAIAAAAGLDPEAHAAAIATPEIKDQLKANTEELAQRGGYGSPTFFVDKTDLYFGNDHLPLVRDAILRQQGKPGVRFAQTLV